MTQPTALFLADALETAEISYTSMVKAAAELRRLHAENEALRKTLAASCDEERQQLYEAGPGGGCSRALSAEFQRDALLEALKEIAADYADRFNLDCPSTNPGIKLTIKQARAAIKAAEENT